MTNQFFSNRTNLIFLHKLMKAFADSLIKVFLPLIILKNSGNFMFVIIYLNSYYLLCGVLNVVLKKFLQKYGIIAIILHTIPIVALQFMLNVTFSWWWCLILAVVASLAQVLYSVPLNLLFALSDKNVDVAKLQIATNIGKLVFTLFSGYVLGSNYKNSLLLLAIIGSVLYILSAVPILYGYRLLKDAYVEASKESQTHKLGDYKVFNLFHIFFGIFQSILDVVIPLYLYVNNLTFETVAIVVALIEGLKMLANILAKNLVKNGHSKASVITSIICFFVGSIVILIVKIPVVLYICSSLIAISFPLLFVPMFGIYCKKINLDNYLFDGMVYRDFFILGFKDFMFAPYVIFPSFITLFSIGLVSGAGVLITAVKLLPNSTEN